MLGSLTLYRRLLLENVFSKPHIRPYLPFSRYQPDLATLPSFGHGIAGIMAGTTVSFIAAPVEHVKARLQVQYAADKSKRMYSGPIDCMRKMVSSNDYITYAATNMDRFALMASADYTAASARRSSSAPFSSSGGAPMTS
jgi:hypothetical protein